MRGAVTEPVSSPLTWGPSRTELSRPLACAATNQQLSNLRGSSGGGSGAGRWCGSGTPAPPRGGGPGAGTQRIGTTPNPFAPDAEPGPGGLWRDHPFGAGAAGSHAIASRSRAPVGSPGCTPSGAEKARRLRGENKELRALNSRLVVEGSTESAALLRRPNSCSSTPPETDCTCAKQVRC